MGGGWADKSELRKVCGKCLTFEQLLFKKCLSMTTAGSVVCTDLDKVRWLFMTSP